MLRFCGVSVLFVTVVFWGAVCSVFSQAVVINEFMSSNGETVADEDGDFEDWIELYNPGTESVDLEGWGISDDLSNPFRWVFPETTIEPQGFLIVWASGKNRPKNPLAVETVLVESGAEWLYLDDGSDQGTAWRLPGFDDSAWASGPAPLGYGPLDDYVVTTVSYGGNSNNKHITTYFRKHFEVADSDSVTTLTLSLWIDDGAVVYLNGVELVRELMPSGSIHYLTTSASYVGAWPEWTHYAVPVNVLETGTNVLAAEVHQISQTSSDLAFDLRLLANASETELHTNFSISAAGEPLTLTRPDETLADEIAPIAVPRDISYGRTVNGGQTWGFFVEPTPGADNDGSTWYSEVLDDIDISHSGGFYTAPFMLTLNHDDPDVTIYYTLDGSEPTPDNLGGTTYPYKNWYPVNPGQSPSGTFLTRQLVTQVYSAPLSITDRSSQPYQLAGINVEFSNATRTPYSNTFKGTVVRARAFKSNAIPSRSVTHTYFVNPNITTRYALPVISIVTDEDGFFDYEKGIYVAGKIGDDWRTANPWEQWDAGKPANYHERGIAWERPAHLEIFDADGTPLLTQNIGARIHGGWSRGWYPKSIRMYARSAYDDTNVFESPIFEGLEKRGHPGEPLTAFRRLILRGSGNDYDRTYFRDALMQELVSHLSLDGQAYRPAVHFINGEYWGMINIRERLDQHYLAGHYEVDPDDVIILTGWNADVDSGFPTDRDHFTEMVSYAQNNDPSQAAHYEWLSRRVDVENLADYYAVQIYYVNTDWPSNNVDFWRKRTADYEPDAPYGRDGRWRWMLYDLDFGMSLYGDNFTTDALNRVITESHGQTNVLFNRLLLNTEFRSMFVNAMADLMNTSLKPAYVHSRIDDYNARLQSSRSEHNNRWRTGLVSSHELTKMQTFTNQRPSNARTHLRNRLNTGADRQLTLDVSDIQHGCIRVNRTDINAQTPGVDPLSPYPWSGLYFQAVPITVTAVAEPGYVFSHWDGPAGIDTSAQTLTLSLTEAVALTAHFTEAPTPTLMHYWSFNNTSALLVPTYSFGGATLDVQPGSSTEVTFADGQDFAGANNRLDEPAATHLRINNPLGATLTLSMPTTGYADIVVMYETRRSGQGAGIQSVSYSTNGTTFEPFDAIVTYNAAPVLHVFDFSGSAGASDNPDFAVRIEFAQGDGGTGGNNRFDNITMDGIPLVGTNQPPQLIEPIPLTEAIEQTPVVIDLSAYFTDPDGDPLTFYAAADKPFVTETAVLGNTLTLTPLYRGDAVITVAAADGHNPPLETAFRLVVYPAAQTLRLGLYRFDAWSPDTPENIFPDGMVFLQSDTGDPAVDTPLAYAYFIPHEGGDGYHSNDIPHNVGFPYRTTGRSRINGLAEDGIAFINTGRQRDLGGALAAIDTTGLAGVQVDWLCGTILENSRRYAIRLQYRVGLDGPFLDVTANGQPVEYLVQVDDHTQHFEAIELPFEAVDQPYVQLLWRYYHVDGTSGSRAQLRLDDIVVSGVLDIFEDIGLFAQWWLATDCSLYDHCHGTDLTRDGKVDLADFAAFAAQWASP